ncbi:hypothetical protein ABT112_09315 [Streptomyces sp. NPDC002055]|uniref:hypothetical protein n=1 Tax=Streptomyces sp. NPDC002055 TaxID=3154534 RepID=UPI00332AC110
MSGDRPIMPPVRLPSEAELARDALAAPLLARAVRLARWAGPGTPVGAGGELLDEGLREAVAHLGLTEDEDGPAHAGEAWRLAVDTGLVDVEEDAPDGAGEAAGAEDGAAGTATPGEAAALVTSGSPRDILDLWLDGLDTVLDDAAAPDIADLVEHIGEGGELDLDALDWDPEEEADFLDSVLGNLYLLTVLDDGSGDSAVPLPALAASVIVPEDMDEPTDEVLEDVSEAMMRLDDQFRLLAPIGLVEYRPVDETLIAELGAEGGAAPDGAAADDADVSRYGMVRLTPLGVYGVRARMLEAGVDAPAVGDLADKGADVLLDRLPGYPEMVAQGELEAWLARRDGTDATRELLAAARGDDPQAPLRRLACQQALLMVGPEAATALREVLDDPRLGGLARVGLAERGITDVPPPPQDMVFWLTIDTIAAQLDRVEDTAELRELVEGVVGQHSGFFEAAWRVDHPAAAEVLEAMGRLHPDKKLAKEARKAAFKARSASGR